MKEKEENNVHLHTLLRNTTLKTGVVEKAYLKDTHTTL